MLLLALRDVPRDSKRLADIANQSNHSSNFYTHPFSLPIFPSSPSSVAARPQQIAQ